MEEAKLIFKAVIRKLWRWIKLFFRAIWNIISFILQGIFFIVCSLIYVVAYTSILWVPILAILLLFWWSVTPVDRGPYYTFNKGWDQVTYLQSEWKCDIKHLKYDSGFDVKCTNLENQSIRDFFTDYYEEGLHYIH